MGNCLRRRSYLASITNLIHEGSEARRKFLDGLLSQLYPSYLDTLLRYNKVLAQRNTLLKSFHERQYLDPDTLDIYDDQLSLYGNKIFQVRLAFLESFLPIFQEQYTHLSLRRFLKSCPSKRLS